MVVLGVLFHSSASTVVTAVGVSVVFLVGASYWMGADDRRRRRARKHRKK